jgi:hypothetical protein
MKPKPKNYPELEFDDLPTELHILLDDPPVTNRDDAALHELTFMGLAHAVKPRDFIEWLILRDMADHRYEIAWGRRLMAGFVRHARKNYKVKEIVELWNPYEEKLKKLNDTIRADLAKQIGQLKGEPEKVKTDTERLQAEAKARCLESDKEVRLKAQKEWAPVQRAIDEELTDADFFKDWIGPYEHLLNLVQRAEQKFDNDLRRLDEYRHGLGESLRKSAREIIDAELEEINPPSGDTGVNDPGAATPDPAPLSPGAPSLQATEASNSATPAATPLSSEGVADSAAISAAAVSCADGQLAVDARENEPTQSPRVAQAPADEACSPEEL